MNISKLGQVSGLHHASANSKPAAASGVQGQSITDGPRSGAVETGGDVDGINPRLADFAAHIDARLQGALANEQLSPRQHDALVKAQEKFHQMIQRLDDAHFSGTESSSGKTPGQSLEALLAHFTSSVNHILTGDNAGDPRPAPQPQPVNEDLAARTHGRGRGPGGPATS